MALSYRLQMTLLAAKLEADINALTWKKVASVLNKATKIKNLKPHELPLLVQRELQKTK